MEINSAAVATIFTFLFAATATATARSSLDLRPADLPVVVQSNDDLKSLPDSAIHASNVVILSTETKRSGSDGADHVLKLDDDRLFKVDLTPRSDFARFHAINRHFFDESRSPLRFVHRRPHRSFRNSFVMPRSEISHGDKVKLKGENGNARKFHHCPSTRLRFNHDYGHHHQHQHRHHHVHHDNKDVSMPKHKFSLEKVKSLVHQNKEKTREREIGLMKSIRKFLKHTFE